MSKIPIFPHIIVEGDASNGVAQIAARPVLVKTDYVKDKLLASLMMASASKALLSR